MTDGELEALVESTSRAMKYLDHVVKVEHLYNRASIRCVNCNGAAAVFSHHPKAMADVKASHTCYKKQWSMFWELPDGG